MKNSIKKLPSLFPAAATWLHMPAFVGWVCFSAGIVTAHLLLRVYTIPLPHPSIPWIIGLSATAALLIRKSAARALLFFMTGFLLFAHTAFQEQLFFSDVTNRIAGDTEAEVHGRVVSVPLRSALRTDFLVAADRLISGNDTLPMRGKIIACTGNRTPYAYGRIRAAGRFIPPRRPANPQGFDEYSFLRSNRVWGRFRFTSLRETSPATGLLPRVALAARATVAATLSSVKNEEIRGIFQAAFLGEKHNLTTHIREIFRNAGIYHLLAISGLHVAILIAGVLFFLARLPLHKNVKISTAILFIWCYLFFVGLIPSLFRAVVMATLILASFMFQRNPYSINSLGLAGLLWLFISPVSLFTPGFQLSFAATLGILTLFPLFKETLTPRLRNDALNFLTGTLLSSLYVSCAGFLATLPVLAYHFGRVSLFGLFANIAAVLIMTVAMYSFFIAILTNLLWAPASALMMAAAEYLFNALILLAGLSRFVPWASIDTPIPPAAVIIVYCVMVTGLTAIDKKYRSRAVVRSLPILFCITPLLILCNSLNRDVEITVFDGQGASLAGIRFPNRNVWLAGSLSEQSFNRSYKNLIAPWLRNDMTGKLDAILLPAPGINIVHDLDPVLARNSARLVITGALPQDDLLEENLDAFLRGYNVTLHREHHATHYIPAPGCTCAIYTPPRRHTQFPSRQIATPAAALFSFGSTRLYLNGSRPASAAAREAQKRLAINNDILLYTEKNVSLLPGRRRIAPDSLATTGGEGALVIRIKNNGNVTVTRVGESAVSGLTRL